MSIIRNASLRIKPIRRLYEARNSLLAERDSLAARVAHCESQKIFPSPFWHYNASIDPQGIVRRHAAHGLAASPDHLTNFLGVRIRPRFFPAILQGKEGQIEGLPMPANWHADVAEWGAALRAVDLARDTFTAIELGCGWGCWLNNTGVAARRAGFAVRLAGIEGDEGHIGFAEEAFTDNGFTPEQAHVRRGIAATASGIALFPRRQQAGGNWDLQPIFGATEEQRQAAAQSGAFDELPMIALGEFAAPYGRVDLLHVDIQGGEADLIAGSLPVLDKKIAYLVIGTHSRQIEGRLLDTLLRAGWVLEIERPAILSVSAGGLHLTVDGVQGWRNPRLCDG